MSYCFDHGMTLFLSIFQWMVCRLLFWIGDVFMSVTSWYSEALGDRWSFFNRNPFALSLNCPPKSVDLSLYGWHAFVVIIIHFMGSKLPPLPLLLPLGAPFLLYTSHSVASFLMISCIHFSPSYALASFSSRSPPCFLGFAPLTWRLQLSSAFENASFCLNM